MINLPSIRKGAVVHTKISICIFWLFTYC